MSGSDLQRPATSRLVGRGTELEHVLTTWQAAVAGEPRVLVVGGDAGIGKSRLATEAARRAADDGGRVLIGRCLAMGADIPYLPFLEILRGVLREGGAAGLDELPPPVRAQLAQLLPETSPQAVDGHADRARALAPGRADPLAAPGPLTQWGSGLARLALFDGLRRMTSRLSSDRPLLVILEDVQWADGASLTLLSFIIQGLVRERLLLLLTVRSNEISGAPLAFLSDIERHARVERLELAELAPAATREQVAAILGREPEPALVSRLRALAGGNPFFTEELLALAGEEPADWSPRLRDILRARFARLSPEAREVLAVASAAGRTVDERVLVEVSGLGAERVTRAVREALAERILAPAGEGVAWGCRFRHDLMRAFVADSMAPSERAGLHARFARAMAGHPAYGSPAEMAYHWDAAGDDARAFDAHVAAGLDAVEAFAFDEAFRHLERALELWARVPDIDDRTALDWPHLAQLAADAAAQAGHLGRAIELARAILERPDVGDPALLAYVRSSLRWHLWRAGRMDEALAEADAAAGSLAEVGDRRWYANALAHHAGLLMLAGQRALARRRAAAAKHVAESVGASEEAALAEGILGWCLVLDGRIDEGIGRIRAVRDATRASRPLHLTGLALAESQHVAALEACGRLEEAVENAMAARAWADTHGLARTFGSVLAAAQARCLYQLGRWTEMSAVLAEASVRGAVSQGRAELAAARALLTAARGEAMDLDGEAVSRVEEAAALPSSGWLDAARAESALWDGDAEKALGLLAGAGGAVPADGRRAPASLASPADASLGRRLLLLAWAAADVALRHRAVRRTVDADRLLEDVRRRVAAAVRRGRLAATGSADLAVARAELVRAASDEHRRVAAWRRAIEASAGQRPYLEAHARWRLAEALVSTSGRRGEAASECLRASGIAGELGARRLAREIELLTRRARLVLTPAAAGEPGAEAAPFGLTAREREVLGLLADGLSNPEIGARLYISPRTASVHVSNILGKLGVDSRVEAATLAHRLGLAGPPLDRDGLDRQGAERAPSAR